MGRTIRLMAIIVVAAAVTFGYRWYRYVSNTETPYDEVGIALNSRMPMPLRKWGCDKLHETFKNGLPPYGCAGADGRSWI